VSLGFRTRKQRSGQGCVPHDFRRTAARNLIRAGVPQHVVMFRRYAIVDERDLRDAVALLVTTGGQSVVGAIGGAR
jgi:hypothetical protein